MLKKVLFVAAALVTLALVRLSERTPLSELEHLRKLDAVDDRAPALLVTTRDAFQAINENALGYLPVMPTLHAEDAIAGVALSVSEPRPTLARGDEDLSLLGLLGVRY